MFRYDTDATDVESSPADLFERGGGVCQDFAHAMIGVLRRAKVPARYASGYIYDEAKGLPDEGLPPGTRWEDVPLNWKCPECGAGKEDFEMIEI